MYGHFHSSQVPKFTVCFAQKLIHIKYANIKYGFLYWTVFSINKYVQHGFLFCQCVSRSSYCTNTAFYFTITWCDWDTLIG